MQLAFALAGVASALVAVQAQTTNMPLPWDGRGYDLTVDTLTDKYLTHILTMRDNTTTGDPADWVSVDQAGRDSYNGDTGVINIGVDAESIFQTQYNFRRSELVQFIEGNAEGTTFFRTSFKKDEAFLNAYQWQIIFPESHTFEIRVDATLDPPMLIYLNNGTWDAKWETEFVPGTWYNFGIGVSKGSTTNSTLEFYTSTGDEDLVLTATHDTVSEFASSYEFHIGLLTLSSDGSQPAMAAEQDILSFNGVSVESEVVTAAAVDAGVASAAASTTSSASAATDASGSETEVEGEASGEDDDTTVTQASAADASEGDDDAAAAATPAPAAGCKRRN